MQESHELSEAECETLLRHGVFGRMAICTPTGPEVFPMNYAVVDRAVVVRTDPHSLLGSRGHSAPLAFEIDLVDHEYQRGWSVVARGTGEWVTDQAELDRIAHTWAPRPWAAGARPRHLRLRWDRLTGRRIGHGWDPLAAMPARRVL